MNARLNFKRISTLFVIALFFSTGWIKAMVPVPIGEVINDYAGILKKDSVPQLENVLKRVERQTGVEITLVTVPTLKDYAEEPARIDSYTTMLFNQWGIGQKPVNNGVLIFLSVKDRMLRFVFGSDYDEADIEPLQNVIKEQVLPMMKSHDFSEGINASALYAIQSVTVPISFWTYHKKEIRWGVFALAALIGCLHFYSMRKHSLTWIFFVLTGVFLFLTAASLSRRAHVNGFGGGLTAGLGFTEKWPTA